jgi:hypothetical protein
MTDEPTVAEAPAPDRSLLIIGGGIVVLVIAAVIAVVALGSREGTAFSADTPEGVVQRHLAAVEDEDYEAAWGYLSTAVQSDLSVDEYRRAARDYGSWGVGSRRVLFDRSEVDGDRARVWLTIEEYYDGGPFGGANTYRSTRDIALVREDGEWRIDDPIIGLEPMPFQDY